MYDRTTKSVVSILFIVLGIATQVYAQASQIQSLQSGKAQIEVTGDIVYSKVDDVELRLDAYIPEGAGPFPAVLVVHGGAWSSGNKLQLGMQARKFAERGMAAFAINYRLAPKYKFPAQIHDCKAAVRWVRSHAQENQVDPNCIGAYGYSAGGHLVALLGVTNGSDGLEGETNGAAIDTRVQCVAAGGALCDFQNVPADSRVLSFWLGGTRDEYAERYRAIPLFGTVHPFVQVVLVPSWQWI